MKDDLSTLMYNVSDNAKILTSRCFKSFIKEDNTITVLRDPLDKSLIQILFNNEKILVTSGELKHLVKMLQCEGDLGFYGKV